MIITRKGGLYEFINQKGLALFVASSLLCSITITVSANELTNFIDDNLSIGIAETELSTTEEMQLTEEQQSQYDLMLSGEFQEFEVGETIIIGQTDNGGILSMTCINSSSELTSEGAQFSEKTCNFYETIAGKETLVLVVKLECSWYANGQDGYISSLKGTYTIINSLVSCYWDEYKVATQHSHALWLNVTYLGSTGLIMFTASYNPLDSTLSFGVY